MNPQEFQFLVFNTTEDWKRGELDNLIIDDRGIRLKSGLQFVPQQKLNRFQVVDIAVGDLTQVYLLDAQNRRIVLFDYQQKYYESIDFLQDLLHRPTHIAYSPSIIYVADELSPSNQIHIYAFAHWFNWQIRWVVTLPLGIKVIDLIADREGTLYVLLNNGEQLIAKYNASGELVPNTGFTRGNLTEPKAITIAPDGHICILTTEAIVRFNSDGNPAQTFARIDLEGVIPRSMQPSGFTVDSEGNFYIGDCAPRTGKANRSSGYIWEEEERFIFCLDPSGKTAQPVTGYRGAVAKLILDRTNHLIIWNSERQQTRILQGERKFLAKKFPQLPTGEFSAQALDSTKVGQRWHKIVLDAQIPVNTQIKVYYASSDDLYGDLSWSEPLINPKDALFKEAKGRYLYLKIELIGSDRKTPTLKSLQIYFPRLSYLRYLPAVYQEDKTSRDFLERFLAIFETYFSSIERQIERIVSYFDAEVVPPNFLPWLAGWLAIAVDDNWTEIQLRQLIQKAPQLYRQRGTREGIATVVEILTGDRPLIVESFQIDSNHHLRDLNSSNPFRFWVLLNNASLQHENLSSLQRLIEAEKPAHTEAVLKVLPPWIALDRESYLGFNSHVFEPALRLDRGAAISQDSILTDPEEYGQLGRRSRLDLDTVLN